MHGTRSMTIAAIREVYGRETVNLRNEDRYYFLNTFFSVSEANMYLQVMLRDEAAPHSFRYVCSVGSVVSGLLG